MLKGNPHNGSGGFVQQKSNQSADRTIKLTDFRTYYRMGLVKGLTKKQIEPLSGEPLSELPCIIIVGWEEAGEGRHTPTEN